MAAPHSSRLPFPASAMAKPAPRRRKKMNRPEQVLQQACAAYLHAVLPPPPEGPVWFHVPNGGGRSKAEAGIFKSMGVKSGIPDLVFLSANPFCIELKADRGDLSDEQEEVINDLNAFGIRTHVCRSLEDVICALEAEQVATRDVMAKQRAAAHSRRWT